MHDVPDKKEHVRNQKKKYEKEKKTTIISWI